MSIKSIESIEEQFSAELDGYLNGIDIPHKLEYEENHELLELGKNLAGKDFSKNSNKEAVLKKIQKNMYLNEGDFIMKRPYKIKRIAVVAACLAVVMITLMQTTFAQELFEKIKNSISLGHITAVQTEPLSQTEAHIIPDELKGKLFDKDGKPLEAFSEDVKEVFTAEGEKIVGFSNSEIVTETQREKEKERRLEIKNPEDLNKYISFKVILPGYLPEGYKFDRSELYKNEDGTVSEKYINLYFTNETTGKVIYMQQRIANEETAYEISTDSKIEKAKINGVDAVIIDDRSINWEVDKVLYSLSGGGEFSKSELIKIAESIK